MAQTVAPIVTLTTDFGLADFHLPRLKGHLCTACPGVQLIDITHQVPAHDIVRAAFILNRVWKTFPPGTIHLLSVNDYYQRKSRFLAIRHEGQYFFGPDNGVFSLIFQPLPDETYVLDGVEAGVGLSAVYARALAHIAADKPFHEVGVPGTGFTERLAFQPVIGPDYIRGTVTFIDRYENVTTNITRERFREIGQGRPFQVLMKRVQPLDSLSKSYHDVTAGEPLCRFSSDGLLEVAINSGRAASLLSIGLEDMVQVQFFDAPTA